MPTKAQSFAQLAEYTAEHLTSSLANWTGFLTTVGRLYKYPYHEQLMIYAQRPDATACADYELWNNKMNRYVRRGSTGIALLDYTGDKPKLKYVFDVSDTGGRENSRRPFLWEMQDHHNEPILEMLADKFDVEAVINTGVAGGLYKDKGVEVIYQAWEQMKHEMPNVHLVLAGPYQPDYPPPEEERVHYLGSLAHHEISTLFQALDLGIISILDTPFGRYCFPQKAYEMLACDLPVVVANIGEMSYLFRDSPQVLFQTGNANDLASKIQQQLQSPQQQSIAVEDWATIIQRLEPMITALKF